VYFVGFRPGDNWSYFPAVPELLITFGIVALEIALYVAAVKTFPILAGDPVPARA
jgi:Ni/Fe-hydrogenase subunit HybB-like protein